MNVLNVLKPTQNRRRLRATLLSNRALCLGKVGEHAGALRDADAAIACDATFAKAWVRRGHALLALRRYADADAAADRALDMEPRTLAKQVAQLKKKCAKKSTVSHMAKAMAKAGGAAAAGLRGVLGKGEHGPRGVEHARGLFRRARQLRAPRRRDALSACRRLPFNGPAADSNARVPVAGAGAPAEIEDARVN